MRQGLQHIVDGCPDLEVVAEVSNGDAAVDVCARLRPDVLLLDVSMPGPGFLEVIRLLRRTSETPAVLVLSVHPEDAFSYRAHRAGASGYVSKQRSPDVLAHAIRTVVAGGTYFGEAAAHGHRRRERDDRASPIHEQLSQREFEVMLMLGEGLRVSEIACRLHLSAKTVSTYRARILEKTRLGSNAAIVAYVASSGLRQEGYSSTSCQHSSDTGLPGSRYARSVQSGGGGVDAHPSGRRPDDLSRRGPDADREPGRPRGRR